MPQISIVIPTYNRASIISRALDSVLSQTFHDWECLVVDDFSIDNTKEIVLDYCKKDKRFKYLINEWKKGANGARNTGILHAKGEYVSFLDSDDVWNPKMLHKQMECYMYSDRIGCVYTDVHFVSQEGQESCFGIPLGIQGCIYPLVLEQGYLAPTSVLSAKRTLLVEVGMFDLQLPASQDDDVCFKLAKKSEVAYVPEVMAYMFAASENRISDNSDKVALGWWLLWNKYEKDVVAYCGKDVMAKHYGDCFRRFVHTDNPKMAVRSYRKYKRFGGDLPKRKRIWLIAYCVTGGHVKYICRKMKNKI